MSAALATVTVTGRHGLTNYAKLRHLPEPSRPGVPSREFVSIMVAVKMNCSAHACIILVLTVLIASLSCGHVVHVGDTRTGTTSSTIEKLHFPRPWLGPTESS